MPLETLQGIETEGAADGNASDNCNYVRSAGRGPVSSYTDIRAIIAR